VVEVAVVESQEPHTPVVPEDSMVVEVEVEEPLPMVVTVVPVVPALRV
jgi:hypothetical protein